MGAKRPARSGPSEPGRDRPTSDLSSLSQDQCIFDIDAEIPDGVFDLRVAERDLDRPKIAGGFVDHCRLGSTH